MESIISEFIPIITIFLLLSYPTIIASISHSSLGRFIAVCIIVFYSSLDKYLGLFVCGLVIFYYQLDFVESFTNEIAGCEQPDEIDDGIYISEHSKSVYHNSTKNQFADYNVVYSIKDDLQTQFRKQYCLDGALKYKNSAVNNEMAEHIFPEIKFKGNKCNPCDAGCDFSIIEEKMNTEEKMKPISTLP